MGMNYYNTLIEVADDCPAVQGEMPHLKGDKKTKPVLEHEMISAKPYAYTEEDIAFGTYAAMHGIANNDLAEERKKFLSQDQACLRVSSLAKRYGWGFHNNGEGKVALVAVNSPEYKKLINDSAVTKIKAFRSKRA